MTARLLRPEELLAELTEARDACAEGAHYLRCQGGVYSARQAARLEMAAVRIDGALTNLRLSSLLNPPEPDPEEEP